MYTYVCVSIFWKYFESTTPPSNFWHWGMILSSHQSWQSATGCQNMTFWKAAFAARWKSLVRCWKRRCYSRDTCFTKMRKYSLLHPWVTFCINICMFFFRKKLLCLHNDKNICEIKFTTKEKKPEWRQNWEANAYLILR
jgi:type IV secretory pathway VirB3-like protein